MYIDWCTQNKKNPLPNPLLNDRKEREKKK